MKNIKKLLLAVVTFVLSLCMINTVSAAEETGSITINGTTNDKIYEVYKIFKLTYSGSEQTDDLKVAYTIDPAWEGFFSSTTGSKYIISENTGSLNKITVEVGENEYATRYINITEDNVAEFAQDALAYLGANSIAKTADKTATGTTTTIDNLPLGYYLVYPEGATKIDEKYASIASITSTTPNAEVNIKATYPTINKTGNGPSFQVGTFATFTITGNVPDTTGFKSYTYKIYDSWTKGLEYESDKFNLTVTIGDYVLTTDEYELTMNTKENDDEIIGFTLKLNVMDDRYEIGDAITVTYDVRVNSFAINSKTTNNSAYLEYSNNPQKTTTSTTTPIEVPVYSSSIEVLKVDGVDKITPLAGAEFVLKNTDGEYYSIKSWGWAQDENGSNIARVYEIEWKEKLEDATVFTSNDEGIVAVEFDLLFTYELTAFEGLKDGTYYLVETKAPEGYNKLDTPIEVTITGSTENERPIPAVKEVTVENNSGTALPSTGGIGTKLFITIGSLLALIAAIVLVTNKRMSKEFM